MALTYTLAQIRTRVQRRADIESFTNRFPTAELNDEINESLARLYGILVSARGVGYYEKTASPAITTVAGTASYALPSDFMALISLETQINGSNVYLRQYNQQERPWLRNISDWSLASMCPMYRLRGNNLDFAPVPNAVYTVNMYYIPSAPQLVNDTDTFDGISGWEEWIVLDVARKCLQKDDRDCTLVLAERAKVEDEIAKEASSRDAANAERVTDRGYVDFSVAGQWWGIR
jgi:hypothetical protein